MNEKNIEIKSTDDMYLKDFYSYDLDVLECGYEVCVRDKTIILPKGRDSYVLHYIESGKGTLIANDKKFNLTAGNMFVLIPGQKVEYYPSQTNPWIYHWVGFKGINAPLFLKKSGITLSRPILKYNKEDELLNAFQNIDYAYNQLSKLNLKCLGYLYIIFSRLIQLNMPNSSSNQSRKVYLDEAIRFISYNYMYDIKIVDIAKNLSITPNYLANIFSSELGISTKKFLISARIKQAARLLLETQLNITEISKQVGYRDILHFSKEFKRLMHDNPTDYRTKNMIK